MISQPRFSQVGLLCLFVVLLFAIPSISNAASFNLEKHVNLYKSAILMESKSGKILYEDRIHDSISPASIVKLMVSLIVLEHLERGHIKLSDKVTVSRWASKIGGHQVYLKEGEVFQLEELMKAVVIGSANDASVAIAEYIGGSQDSFVEMMNERALKLKMKNTQFYNPHGLPAGRGQKGNTSTAYDLALLGKEILKHPQYLVWSSTQQDKFRNGTFHLLNTNIRLLQKMPNVDGLKTGYHNRAGFSVVATAKRGNTRLIAVVAGSRSERGRIQTTARLLAVGLKDFGNIKVLEKGIELGKPIPVENGLLDSVSLLTSEGVEVFLRYSEKNNITQHFNLPTIVKAPIAQGMVIGSVELHLQNEVLKKIDLISAHGVKEKTFWDKVGDLMNL